MKHFPRKVGAVFLLSAFVLTEGCGTEQIYTMTDAEETAIVDYAARVISKYNQNQREGVVTLSDSYVNEELGGSEEETASTTDQTSTDEASDAAASTEGTASESTDTSTASSSYVSMSDALGIDGLVAEYGGYEITSDYVEEGIYDLPATSGNELLVVDINLINTGAKAKKVNMLTSGESFTVKINGETSVEAMTTLALQDLSTYAGKIKASATEETVLIFEVPEGTGSSISSLELQVTGSDGTTSLVSLQ